MKCTLICRGPGLLGPLVNIREACNSHYTSIFKDTLGLFHLSSQRGRSRPIYPCSCFIALSPNPDLCQPFALTFLPSLIFLFVFCSLLPRYHDSGFPYPRVSCSPAVFSFCVVRQDSGAAETDEGMSTCLPSLPFSFFSAQPRGCQRVEEIEMRLTMLQLVLLWL